ncbi:MAG TPA: hypothetical protein VN328_06415 [Thermodesulfovibrionales bacterium]|nr:hypothetical protein [Thermodesulfovibrionales bacterium]
MIKMIMKLIFLFILAVVVFIALSVYSGGDKFRWFGTKVKQESEKVGEKADKIKKGSDTVMKGIEKTTETVKEITGSKDSKKEKDAKPR